MKIQSKGNSSVHTKSISLQVFSVHCSVQAIYHAVISHVILSLHWSCLYTQMFVQHQSGHLWNNCCYDCSQHIKRRLRDERTLVTKACRDSWNKTKLNNGAGWDFKLRNTEMQAVIFTQFAIIKCHDLLQQIWQVSDPLNGCYAICKTSLYRTTTSSTKVRVAVFSSFPQKTSRYLTRGGDDFRGLREGWEEGVSQRLFLGHILWCFRVFWAVCFIEYSYCWCSGWVAIIMPEGQVAWP